MFNIYGIGLFNNTLAKIFHHENTKGWRWVKTNFGRWVNKIIFVKLDQIKTEQILSVLLTTHSYILAFLGFFMPLSNNVEPHIE